MLKLTLTILERAIKTHIPQELYGENNDVLYFMKRDKLFIKKTAQYKERKNSITAK